MEKMNLTNIKKFFITMAYLLFMRVINRLSNFYTRNAKIIRFSIILIIALWANFYLIPDLKIPSNNLQKIESDNTTYIGLGSFDLTPEDLTSGNFNSIFWKFIYLGGGRDKICFEKTNLSNNNTFSASYNNGDIFNITNKKCFDIPKEADKITFQVSYGFSFTLPTNLSLSLRRVVNKSECVWITGNDTCITQEGIDSAVTWVFHPDGEVYLEANLFHKLVKFIFIFFSTGALLWAFSRTIQIILYGWFKQ